MKTKTKVNSVLISKSLVVFTLFLFTVLSWNCTCSNEYPQTKHGTLTIEQANEDFLAYWDQAKVYRHKIEGIVINRDQVNAILDLEDTFDSQDIECIGYRIYYGIDKSFGNNVSLLVGLTVSGTDTTEIYEVDGESCIKGCDGNERTWGNCPYVCDNESEITSGMDPQLKKHTEDDDDENEDDEEENDEEEADDDDESGTD